MTLLESWLGGLTPDDRRQAAAELLRFVEKPKPEPKPRAEGKPKHPGTKNLHRASPTADYVPATRLEVTLDLDPLHLGAWLTRKAADYQTALRNDTHGMLDRAVGIPRSPAGYRNPLAVYLKEVLGVGAKVKDLAVYLLIGSQEYVAPLPLWARRFAEACDHEPTQHAIFPDRAVVLLRHARDVGARV